MPTVAEAFSLALRYHQAGNLDLAERLYQQILQADPSHAGAHHLLGVLAYQMGRFDVAIASIRQSLRLSPNQAEPHCNLGVVLAKQAHVDEAVAQWQEAIRIRPAYPQAHNNLGKALLTQGKVEEAVWHCQEALRFHPGFAEAHNNLANALLSQGKLEEALAHYHHALRCRPEFPEAHNNLGGALLGHGRAEEAITHFKQALRLRPDFPEAHNDLANALLRQDMAAEAEAHCRQALRWRPNYPEAYNNLGTALLELDRLDEAIRCFRDAVRANPNFAEAWGNLGNALAQQKKLDEAIACYQETIRIKPNHAAACTNRAVLRLLLGDWVQGWPEYERRFETEDFTPFAVPQPRWDGSPLAGRTLLVIPEQGLGDTLHCMRYVLLLQQRGERVILQCQPPLLRLLSDCLDKEHLVVQGAPLPEFDVYASLLSLPGILGTTPTSMPAPVPYLRPDADLVAHWRRELNKGRGTRDEGRGTRDEGRESSMTLSSLVPRPSSLALFLVGIAWQGSPTYRYDHLRSIPLAQFAPLARVEGVRLISLQIGPGTDPLQGRFPVLDLGSRLDEASGRFMDTAAVMMNLDLVISSDTAVPHLAGALGVPVWLALPLFPDWRWLLEREDSPWYPTMRLFRQTRYGHWEDVFERMAEELKAVVSCQLSENQLLTTDN